ncbi:sigma-70 family RNA polymerase sigma factor [Foetidibacter luteolus]|uniref:sigma-70 family RNA polymerase sigma factor n=1 Tax=Foetidibacter luteolus TaxID=2608880 RepID=UPI00129B6704|nr:sigma-70 family RNA polymerase sigma factor [Foetidibacter luteolus]
MEDSFSLQPDKWVDNYADKLYTYAMARVANAGAAEDIVQETFLSAWKARDTYNKLASEKTWLYVICKNKITDYYRRQPKFTVPLNTGEEDVYFDQTDHWTESTRPQNWPIDYHGTMERKEFYKILYLCKSKLKEFQQRVFALKYLEELGSDEICDTLSISKENYWVLLHRAKLHIRACLEKNWLHIK